MPEAMDLQFVLKKFDEFLAENCWDKWEEHENLWDFNGTWCEGYSTNFGPDK